jgi:CspA family cold shock protein
MPIAVVIKPEGPDAYSLHAEDGSVFYVFKRNIIGRIELQPGDRVTFAVDNVATNRAVNVRRLDGQVYHQGHQRGTTMQGRVVNFNDMAGWGFLEADQGGPHIFVHKSNIANRHQIDLLQTGTRVSFEVAPSQRKPGKHMAINVRVVE